MVLFPRHRYLPEGKTELKFGDLIHQDKIPFVAAEKLVLYLQEPYEGDIENRLEEQEKLRRLKESKAGGPQSSGTGDEWYKDYPVVGYWDEERYKQSQAEAASSDQDTSPSGADE